MENKTYLVDLTPIGNYFFGSENTFSSTDKATIDTSITNYLVRSRMYPQQTTLLGLMRYVLLIKEGKLNKPVEEKNALIGSKSFQGADVGSPEKWGIINSISPLFLKNGDHNYKIAGQDYQFYKDKNDQENLVVLNSLNEPNNTFSFNENAHRAFTNYDPKHYAELLWKADTEEECLRPDDIFVESFQVGIKKSFTVKSDNDAFYKQFFFRLTAGFSFAFYLNIDGDIKDALKAVVVPSGADQSLFRVTFKEEESIFNEPETPEGPVKITLLSDAFLTSDVLDTCELAISGNVDFRYIKTNTGTKRYYNISKSNEDMQKSAKLNLVERGSVFYFDDPSAFIEALTAPVAYRNIGFNQYKIESVTL